MERLTALLHPRHYISPPTFTHRKPVEEKKERKRKEKEGNEDVEEVPVAKTVTCGEDQSVSVAP